MPGGAGVQFLRANALNPSTRSRYSGALRRISEWHGRTGGERFLTGDGALDLSAVVNDLHNGFYAFVFDQVGLVAREEGLRGLANATLASDGVSYGSAASYRSALQNGLKRHVPRLRLSEEQDEELQESFRTLKNLDARRRQDQGLGSRRTGKVPLPQPVFRVMMEAFLKTNADATCWSHLFAGLTWNLMCRADNTDHIAVPDIGWDNDALTIRFAKSKTDQGGAKGDLERHVYANPLDAVLCPVTALGLYLMSCSAPDALLFSSARKQKTLGEHMTAFFESAEGKTLCERLGLDPTMFATHSLRKGSTSWCTCGTTASPSVLATLTRGGWATGAAWERYMHLLGHGQDCYIGRVLACLPVVDAQFALLPPHFDPEHSATVTAAVETVFGPLVGKHPQLGEVLRHCLASVVHHADRLMEILPATHQLRHRPIFANRALLDSLRACLYTKDRYQSPFMTATGIPPHAQQLRELRKIQEEIAANHAAHQAQMDQVKDQLLVGIEELLERRTVEQGGVTPATMRSLIAEAISGLQLPGTAAQPDVRTETPPPPPADDATRLQGLDVFPWGGGFHLVPEEWRLPTNATLKTGWELWCSGSPVPYRKLNSRDRVHDHKRYNDWKAVFNKAAAFLKKKDLWVEHPTHEQTHQMFAAAAPFFKAVLQKARRFEDLRPTYASQYFRPVQDSQIEELAATL